MGSLWGYGRGDLPFGVSSQCRLPSGPGIFSLVSRYLTWDVFSSQSFSSPSSLWLHLLNALSRSSLGVFLTFGSFLMYGLRFSAETPNFVV